MANQSIGKPRFYLDFTQLAKVKGFWRNLTDLNTNNTNGIYEYDENEDRVYGEKNMNVWNFDYTNPTNYTCQNSDFFNFRLAFWNPNDSSEYSLEWAKLLQTANWGGLINHNIRSQAVAIGSDDIWINFYYWSPNGNPYNYWTEDTQERKINYDGYTIFTSTVNDEHLYGENGQAGDLNRYSALVADVHFGEDTDAGEGELQFDLGAIAFGKYIDMPNSPDLKVEKSIEYDGITMQRSLGGADYVQINNLGSPDWINGEPWSLTTIPSKGRIGKNGRRRWKMSFSYISGDDLFYDISKSNISGDETLDPNGYPISFNSTSEIQQIWDLTLGGSLPFIFTPNKDATNIEYCTCRFDQSSLKAKQVSYNVWNISFNIYETW